MNGNKNVNYQSAKELKRSKLTSITESAQILKNHVILKFTKNGNVEFT